MEELKHVVNRQSGEEEASSDWAQRITVLPPFRRVVAIGDVHGDVHKLRRSLLIAAVMDDSDRWIGHDTVLVQLGDVLDKGPHELEALALLESLNNQALPCGGQVITLLGNHELLNFAGDFAYAHPHAVSAFDTWKTWALQSGAATQADFQPPRRDPPRPPWSPESASRRCCLCPGGPATRRYFGNSPAVLVVGSTVFVHAGLRPYHVDYGLQNINSQAREYVLGRSERPPRVASDPLRGLTWIRDYSDPREAGSNRAAFDETLAKIGGGVQRMVVGHSPQEGGRVAFRYEQRLACVDIGLSRFVGDAEPEVLVITNDVEVHVITSKGEVLTPDQRPASKRDSTSISSAPLSAFRKIFKLS